MTDDGQFDASRWEKTAWINTAVPNANRVADFLNGGRDSFETDRRAAAAMLAAAPAMAAVVPGVLAFHRRAVRFLTVEAGGVLRQFLLDDPAGVAVILVPPLLVDQWARRPAATWRSRPTRPAGSSTSTTTRWCCRMSARSRSRRRRARWWHSTRS